MRRFDPITALVLLLAACGETSVPRDLEIVGTRPVHWRVIWTEDPAHRAVVSWSTAEPGTSHHLYLDTAPHQGEVGRYPAPRGTTRDGAFGNEGLGSPPELWFHHVELSDLSPGTTYWFVAESDGQRGPELHFATAPDDDRNFAILSGSDSRSDRGRRRAMNLEIAGLAAADPTLLAFAHGGDYVWSGHERAYFRRWLTDQELTITAAGRVLPIIPARGNHETVGKLFDEVFCWPGGGLGRNYYVTRLAPDVVLWTLNTEVAAGGDQAEFLSRSMVELAEVRWQLAQYHQPAYPSVKTPSHAKQHWVPIFDAQHLDLAIESDGHTLKRTMPIRGDRPAADGVVYIGEGGLGVSQRSPDRTRWYLRPPAVARSAHHLWRLDFTPTQLGLTALGIDGTVLDSAAIAPRPR